MMGKAVKVTISLSREMLAAADRERLARGETRSEFFRAAVQTFLREIQEQADIERYVQGYREFPETDVEIQAVHAAGQAALAQEPWE